MRITLITIVALLIVLSSRTFTLAQSKDRDNPTKFSANVVSDTLSPDKQGSKYYYSFVGSPGEFTVTLTLESDRGNNIVQAGLRVFDEREVQLGAYQPISAYSGSMQQTSQTFTLRTRQQVTILFYVTPYNTGRGKYRIRVSGPINFESQDSPDDVLREATADYPECVPKRGTLVIRMKDGSKKTVELSDVEKLFVLH